MVEVGAAKQWWLVSWSQQQQWCSTVFVSAACRRALITPPPPTSLKTDLQLQHKRLLRRRHRRRKSSSIFSWPRRCFESPLLLQPNWIGYPSTSEIPSTGLWGENCIMHTFFFTSHSLSFLPGLTHSLLFSPFCMINLVRISIRSLMYPTNNGIHILFLFLFFNFQTDWFILNFIQSFSNN